MRPLSGNKGFSIISAIFVLVILSLLGLAMLTINSVLHTSSAQSMSGVRAYYTAVSGLEWATYQATSMCQSDHDAICDNVQRSFNLNGFTVTYICNNYGTTFDDGGIAGPYDLDTITVTAARNGPGAGSPDQVSRTLSATVTRDSDLPPFPPGNCVSSL